MPKCLRSVLTAAAAGLAVGLLAAGCSGKKTVITALPTAGSAVAISIAGGDGQTGVAGAALAAPLVVTVTDAAGLPVTAAPVSFAVTGGGGSVAAVFSASGILGEVQATWTLGSAAGANTVTATLTTASGGTQAVTFTATGVAGPAASLAITSGDGQGGTVGGALAAPLVVTVRDARGNGAPGVPVTFLVTAGLATTSQVVVSTSASGAAQTTVTLGTTPGAVSVQASVAGVSPVTFAATAGPGAAVSLAFTQQPTTVPVLGEVSPPVTVTLRDGFANVVTSTTAGVTFAIGTNPGGGVMSVASATVTTANGVATVQSLTIDRSGLGYTLTATAAGLPQATSAVFDVRAIPAIDGLGHVDNALMNFSRTNRDDGRSPSALNQPGGVALDPVGHRLFVADQFNNRVLVFSLTAQNGLSTTGRAAAFVLGQPDFVSGGVATSAIEMNAPGAVAFDQVGQRLFVADTANNRVLVFSTASISNGMPATNVLGQPGFISNAGATTQAGMQLPEGLAFDGAAQRLYVADRVNNRVLVFDVASITDGENAANVLGQPDFTSFFPATSQSGMNDPGAVVFEPSANRLYVADSSNNRVLVFDVAAIADGENAVNVLGQPDFVSNGSSATQASTGFPLGLAHDAGTATLYVTAQSQNRVLTFITAALANGMPATDGLGHMDGTVMNFTRTLPNDSPAGDKLDTPQQVTVDTTNRRLFVCDQGNHRVLVFNLSTGSDLVGTSHTAAAVLGQPDFVTTTLAAASASTFNTPSAIEYHAGSNRLFVGDSGNHRVLVFDVAAVTNGEAAVNVLGQVNFAANGAAVTQTGLNNPSGLSYEPATGRLFVSDRGANRVLVFAVPPGGVTDGEAAVNVLGQASFTSNGAATTQAGLSQPIGLELDAAALLLYVADRANHRVVVFDVAAVADGENAVNVLGQADFVSNGFAVSRSRMNTPTDVAVDVSRRRLYVSDTANHRVLRFNVASLTNGMTAVSVLGQPSFSSAVSAAGSDGMMSPDGLGLAEGAARLFVAEGSSHRVTVFAVP